MPHAFHEEFVYVHRPPLYLLSDNGRQFVLNFFQDFLPHSRRKNVFTTTSHPQANRQVERFNRTLLEAFFPYVTDHLRYWVLYTDTLTPALH